MLWVLVKKQLAEVFRNYFYDEKKNKMRSKWAVAAWFIFFILLMAGVLGGMFTALSLTLCEPLDSLGIGWLYFLLMSILAVVLGAFGSVFNTYSGLYLSKDNDLLLSMPIPIRTIVTARIINVWLLGTMYSATVLIPMLAVYWVKCGFTASRFICGILLFVIISLLILFLSCALGWVVAKVSVKLKNKSYISVLLALAFLGLYYFFYFKAAGILQDMLANALIYGEKIKGSAYPLYLFGRIGEGDWLAAGLYTAIAAVLTVLTLVLLSRTFLKIAAAGGSTEKKRYVEKTVRQKTVFAALLQKEFSRFTSSANYMLNCGLGTVFIPLCGGLLLYKGKEAFLILEEVFRNLPGFSVILICAGLCTMVSMNDMAAPSISLEGKSLWIPQSLPVEPRQVLLAKTSVQLILTGVPLLFAVICAVSVVNTTLPLRILLFLMPLIFMVFSALFCTFIGLKMPLFNWTNELSPIKQSGAILIALLGSWAVCAVFVILYMTAAYKIGAVLYMSLWTALFAVGSLILLYWMNHKGAEEFKKL